MRRRKLARKVHFRAARRWAYKRAYRLHEYEDRFVLALIVERGSGEVDGWDREEPGRWDRPLLQRTFYRLRQQGLIRRSHVRTHSWSHRRSTVYVAREAIREELAA